MKSFPLHQFFKNDRILFKLRCISLLIMVALIYIPLEGFSYSGNYRFKTGKTMRPPAEKKTKLEVNDVRITGTVKDEKGNPLEGVSVSVVGQTSGVSTDNLGNFSISVPPSAELRFSYVGYKPFTVKVGDQLHLDITLSPEVSSLDDVVVTALGISRQKRSLGYSVSDINSEDLVKAANPNVLKSLDGKVSGVNLTNLSSDPTSSVMVNIRGTTTMPSISSGADVSSRSQPLYVIDGIPVGTQTFTSKDGVDFGNILSQLNPEDIASVSILKGGSAGALYGAQGGNGVVMITTKSGRGGQKGLGVSYNLSALADQPYQFIAEQMQYGQGERIYEWQYDNTDTWGPPTDGSFTADYWDVKAQQWANGPQISSNEDRVKAYLRTGNTITNSISVFGNYTKGSFRFSMSNMGNEGVMPNTKTNQKSFNLNTEYRITNNVRISVSANYFHTYSPNKQNSVGSNSVLNSLLFNFPNNLQPLSEMHNYWLTGFEGSLQNGSIMDIDGGVANDNPWFTTYEYLHRFTRDNYFGKVQLDWQMGKAFSLLLRTGMDNVKENYELRKSWGSRSDKYGQFVQGSNANLQTSSDVILTYSNNFKKFSLSASVGGNYAYSNTSSMEATAGDLSTPALFTLANAAPGTLSITSGANAPYNITQGFSAYALATVGYNNQLFLDVTGREDFNGAYAEQKINYFYPSASLSWIASETFKLPEIFNLLKGRLAVADVGNGLLKQRSVDTYSFETSDWGAAKTVVLNAALVDPDIKPQHSITTELGADIWMLKNRIKFDFTYFEKVQKNQLDNIPLVPGTGYTGLLTNIGNVTSKGYEWGLTVTPVRSKNWNWDVSASFTHYKATITKLSDKFAPNGYIFANYDGKTVVKIAKGEEIGNIYEQNAILRVKTGKYKGMPLLDGEGGEFQNSPDNADRRQLANFNPDFILGLNTTLRYKRFSINIVGSLRKGGQYISVNQQYLESNGRVKTTFGTKGTNNPYWEGGRDASLGGLPWPAAGSSQYEAINNNNDGQRTDEVDDASYAKGVFVNPDYTGDPADAKDEDYIVNGADKNNTFYQYPYNSYGDVIWNFSSTRTYDATNFKLREISIAYTLPDKLISKYKMNNLTLSLIGRNIFQWNKSGRHEDPESAFSGVGTNQGILRATLPSIRSYGIKLGVNF
ncbi:SusC/RagA family TonB-linked outer membrane protein [Parafilimonas sp.]|uniref:SusC/RagA family TonB-linked outer membrane protein n=1 Tax=Parafilimonas sp. TaxID=1969739 RepID=UPI003F7D13C8